MKKHAEKIKGNMIVDSRLNVTFQAMMVKIMSKFAQ